MRGGTYSERILNGIASGSSWSNKVRIANYPGETVWLQPPSNVNPNSAVFLSTSVRYIEFDGININASALSDAGFVIGDPNPGGAFPDHIRLMNAEIIGGGGYGSGAILIGAHHSGGAIGGNEFTNLTVHGGDGYGIYVSGPNNLVDHCDVYDTSTAGIHIYNGGGDSADNNIIRNNRIHDMTRSINFGKPDTRMWGILIAGNNNQVYNNLVYKINFPYASGNAGVQIYYGSGNKIYNNTITNNTTDGIFVYLNGTNSDVRNNILYANGGSQYSDGGSGTIQSNNLVGVDPLFVNASVSNFQLQSTSRAVDAGAGVSGVTTDIVGLTRPQGSAIDIGAYEYGTQQGSPSAAPAPPTGVRIVSN